MKLWLQGVSDQHKIVGVRALIDFAQKVKGAPQATSDTRGAIRVWDQAQKGQTTLLLHTDDPAVMQEAVNILERGRIKFEVTRDEEFPTSNDGPAPPSDSPQLPAKSPPAQRERPASTTRGSQVAAVLLVAADGNPTVAFSFCRSLAMILEDEFWDKEVAAFLQDTFPSEQELQQRLEARQRGSDDSA